VLDISGTFRSTRETGSLAYVSGHPDETDLPGGTSGRFVPDSPLEGDGFEPVWGFSCQVVFLVCYRFFVRSETAVPRPVACDQVRGARGRGQGTETVAELGGLPPSRACVSQRLDA
jgi:hypothetical protein